MFKYLLAGKSRVFRQFCHDRLAYANSHLFHSVTSLKSRTIACHYYANMWLSRMGPPALRASCMHWLRIMIGSFKWLRILWLVKVISSFFFFPWTLFNSTLKEKRTLEVLNHGNHPWKPSKSTGRHTLSHSKRIFFAFMIVLLVNQRLLWLVK